MKQNVTENEINHRCVLSIALTANQRKALQKAWQRTGEYRNRTQWIKEAINTFANEEIFP